jgi:hypothetical protein
LQLLTRAGAGGLQYVAGSLFEPPVRGAEHALPAVERFIAHASTVNGPQASALKWIPSFELYVLDLGLRLTLYTSWRVAQRLASGDRMALAAMSPWAVLAVGLYSAGVWIVFQPMQMRGMMMH